MAILSSSPGRGSAIDAASTRPERVARPSRLVSRRAPGNLGQMSQLLQRSVGNRAAGRLLVAARAQARGLAGPPIQRFGDMSLLRKTGWRYSGGTIATHSGFDDLWHATVFRVDKTGASAADGLFYNGFHLTMPFGPSGSRIEPHVFFDSSGGYDEASTLGHRQTKDYITAVGKAQWDFDLGTAKALSENVVGLLGPVLSKDERAAIESARKEKQDVAKEQQEAAAAEAAKKLAQEQRAAADADDESKSIDLLLKDVSYIGG